MIPPQDRLAMLAEEERNLDERRRIIAREKADAKQAIALTQKDEELVQMRSAASAVVAAAERVRDIEARAEQVLTHVQAAAGRLEERITALKVSADALAELKTYVDAELSAIRAADRKWYQLKKSP